MNTHRFLQAGVLAWLLAAPALAAQLPADTTARREPSRQQQQQGQQQPVIVSGAAMDRPVSRTEYRLAPGDVLAASLFGEVSEQHTVPVNPEGAVVVPGIGVARVLGLNLDEAETRVRNLVGRYYRDIEVRLTLVQLRTIKVFLVGNVAERGVRVATPTTRVSEILPPQGAGVQRRNITLRRANGDSIRPDLVRFLQTGDVRDNPTLLEGDAVVVPVLNETVEVFGEVAFPNRYEFRPGESLTEFLSVANGGGPFPAGAADTIRIARFGQAGTREVLVLSRAEALGARGQGMLMRPFDAIYIPAVANYRLQRTAVVSGQVRYPGTYPIQPDTTTVRDLVAMAGGFTPQASLTSATLRRARNPANTPSREFMATPDSALSREEREIRQISREGLGENYVVVDFERLFASGHDAYNQPLQGGDVLTIPRQRNEVTVLGGVLRPGVVAHTHGASYLQYVALAGGYSRRADRGHVSIIRAGRGNRVDARDAYYPGPGDQIVVPFRERRTFLERVQGVSAVAGTISSAIVTVLALTRIF